MAEKCTEVHLFSLCQWLPISVHLNQQRRLAIQSSICCCLVERWTESLVGRHVPCDKISHGIIAHTSTTSGLHLLLRLQAPFENMIDLRQLHDAPTIHQLVPCGILGQASIDLWQSWVNFSQRLVIFTSFETRHPAFQENHITGSLYLPPPTLGHPVAFSIASRLVIDRHCDLTSGSTPQGFQDLAAQVQVMGSCVSTHLQDGICWMGCCQSFLICSSQVEVINGSVSADKGIIREELPEEVDCG
mmetsp:Transcript_38061/g.89078  ORF Transcript_38061/g.89078 Transcript_38061/m.89078 type:complete len:245 (-) Transcript_38061:706-1440(-)